MEDGHPQREVGWAAQVAFTQRHEQRNLLDAVRPKVGDLDAVEGQQLTEEVGGGESEPAVEEAQEDHELPGPREGLHLVRRRNSPSLLLELRDDPRSDVREERLPCDL
jgi:hypothetical protein